MSICAKKYLRRVWIMNKPDAILTADWHLREDKPRRRTDDYFNAQVEKIRFVSDLQIKYEIPILDAGDLFNKWRVPPWLETWAIVNLPYIVTIPGNHDLPEHNVDSFNRSSLSVLNASMHTDVLINQWAEKDKPISAGECVPFFIHNSTYGIPWNSNDKVKYDNKINLLSKETDRRILLIHKMVSDVPLKYKMRELELGTAILKKYPEFGLIVSGHNHKSFVIEFEGRLLVNPGSMMRMSKDQIDFRPKVYLWYADENRVEPVYLPIKKDVFSEKKIREEKDNEERMESFVEALNTDYEFTLSFQKNIENYFENNKVRKPVRTIIERCLNGPCS